MSCENDWTIKFPLVGLEIRPLELTYRERRGELNHCRLKFPWELGEELKPEASYEGGALRPQQPVHLKYDGDHVETLLWRPGNLRHGDFTHIQLIDLQRSLESGLVDYTKTTVQLKDIYQYIFDQRENDILTDLKFTVPESVEGELVGEQALNPDTLLSDSMIPDNVENVAGNLNRWIFFKDAANIEANDTRDLANSYFAADFDQVSPLAALWELNRKYGITTWTDGRTLWVGIREARGDQHIAARFDDRVWKYNQPSISHPRQPIKGVRVKGSWVDEAGLENDPGDIIDWFNPLNEKGSGDVRIMGYASRTDVSHGKILQLESKKAKKDAIKAAARVGLRQMVRQQNTGTVGITPELSGDYTPLHTVSTGDFLWLVPDDQEDELEHPWCDDGVQLQNYVVNGVTHDVSGGNWSVDLDLTMYPDSDVTTGVRYFDPQSDEFVSESEVMDFDWLEHSEPPEIETLQDHYMLS